MSVRLAVIACLLSAVSSCGRESPTQPFPNILGEWKLIGYSDHGVSGVTTGDAVFLSDETFAVNGTVTYPGEPTDTLDISGTYRVVGKTLNLTTSDGTSTWSMALFWDRLVLTLIGSRPPTTMTLEAP